MRKRTMWSQLWSLSVLSEIDMWFRMWAQNLVEWWQNLGWCQWNAAGSMYVAFFWIDYWNQIIFFKGWKGKTVGGGYEFYWWSELEITLGCEWLSSEQISTIDKNGSTHIQIVSNFWVYPESLMRSVECAFSMWVTLADWNHWCEEVNTLTASELLSSVWANQNHWWEWLNTCPVC